MRGELLASLARGRSERQHITRVDMISKYLAIYYDFALWR
jgi:hypothetical protein